MVTTAIIDEISRTALSDRVMKLKEEYFAAIPHLDHEKSRLVTESWKETEGEPLDLRRARAFRKIAEGISILIRDKELIVGSQSRYVRGTSPAVDFSSLTVLEISQAKGPISLTGMGAGVKRAPVSDEVKTGLLEDAQYWKGKSPQEIIDKAGIELFGENFIDLRKARLYMKPPVIVGRLPNYPKVLNKGLDGIIAEAKAELQKLASLSESDAMDKYYFLQSVIMACEATITYARRYAGLAGELAGKEKDQRRKRELEKIAEICQRVPARPARTFYEALQGFWFIHLCMNLEGGVSHEVPGRMDQYLYPIYEKDLEEGRISRQEAMDLLGCLRVKFAEMTSVAALSEREISETNQGQNVTIGGVDANGRDASNELTYMLLEVARQVRTTQPALNLRCHRNTPEELWVKATEVNKERGDGVPAFLNDEAEIPYLVSKGVSYADARDWAGTGCVYALGPGFPPDAHITVNHAKIFELTLNNGVDPMTGKVLGLATGDPRTFSSYGEFYEAFKKQDQYFITLLANYHRLFWQTRNRCYSLPFNSALVDDCISKGKGFFSGGSRYPQLYWGLKDRGNQNIADSLAAIKKLVFEEKKITMDRLLKALKANFGGEGDEEIRRMCLAVPKYGNDDDYVDEIFNDFDLWSQRRIVEEKHVLGHPMRSGRGGATTHAYLGKTVGALPDGRKAWEPLADGSLSPMRGVDVKGPTAVINSASKVNHTEQASYSLFNMKIAPSILKSRDGVRKFISLIKTYFDRGGYHVQFNLMGQEVLCEAQEHPEQYRDLLVRVAGYSAYFVELSREVQDDIIGRREHTL